VLRRNDTRSLFRIASPEKTVTPRHGAGVRGLRAAVLQRIVMGMTEQAPDYPTSGETCAWKGSKGTFKCPYPAWTEDSEGRCLYHSPENGKTEDAARQVWDEARRKAERPDPRFSGWHFPEDPDEKEFKDATFEGDVWFNRATFQGDAWFVGNTFQGYASFDHTIFQGDAKFDGGTFERGAIFDGASFKDNAEFSSTFRGEGAFRGATFQGKAWFRDATFQEEAWFEDATFQEKASFGGATFQGAAEFQGATFTAVWFEGATFQGTAGFRGAAFVLIPWFEGATFERNAWFEEATFERNAWFEGATFERNVWFEGATFQEKAWFGGATFQGIASFRGATFQGEAAFAGANPKLGADIQFDTPSLSRWLWGKRPFRRTEEGETAYRLAKQAAQARGDYTEAGRYHYAEQCAIEARARKESSFKPWRKAFWTMTPTWLARLLFGRIVFGYGERPFHPLLLALAVIACWTGLYYSLDAIEASPTDEAAVAEPATLGESLYFSMVTFTTLGYGDFKPKPNCRLLAGAEAALGAGLMATFIVCLTRKYMR